MYALHTPECTSIELLSVEIFKSFLVKLWHPAYGAAGCPSQGVAHQEAAETLGYAKDEVSLKSARSTAQCLPSDLCRDSRDSAARAAKST